jgi:fructokinase
VIAAAGEALIDLIVGLDGKVDARPGGGPFNVARTAGRLGLRPAFLGRLSADGFGRLLLKTLEHDGADVALREPSEEPTTLAVVDLDAGGVPLFHFHLAGTSAAALGYRELVAAMPKDVSALHVGSLGLAVEPIADSIASLVGGGLAPGVMVMVDPNCRPHAITDKAAYLARIERIMRRADVIKASTDDLAYLGVGADVLLGWGPALVLVTDGPRPVRVVSRDETFEVPVPPVRVVDTLGAGDSFGGAFLAWWRGHDLRAGDLRRPDLVRQAVEASVEVSRLTCSRAGAEPPWASELAARPGWEWLPGA